VRRIAEKKPADQTQAARDRSWRFVNHLAARGDQTKRRIYDNRRQGTFKCFSYGKMHLLRYLANPPFNR
jgi:hypothetical protein